MMDVLSVLNCLSACVNSSCEATCGSCTLRTRSTASWSSITSQSCVTKREAHQSALEPRCSKRTSGAEQTYSIASNDEEAILAAENSLCCIWRSHDELLHRRVAQRSCDRKNAINARVHHEPSSVGDSLHLLRIRALVIVCETHRFAAATTTSNRSWTSASHCFGLSRFVAEHRLTRARPLRLRRWLCKAPSSARSTSCPWSCCQTNRSVSTACSIDRHQRHAPQMALDWLIPLP